MSIYGNIIHEGLFTDQYKLKDFNKKLFFEEQLKKKESKLAKDSEELRYDLSHPKNPEDNPLESFNNIHFKFINIEGYLGIVGIDKSKNDRVYSLEMIRCNSASTVDRSLVFDMRLKKYSKYFNKNK